jgi:hypothetical protein
MSRPILCVDFDGVIHSYTTPWKGIDVIPDPPVPGALQWLAKATEYFVVTIYSSRSMTPDGINAMIVWMERHAQDEFHHVRAALRQVVYAAEKPAAFLTIDDRALTFNGNWSAPELEPGKLLKFRPWNKQPTFATAKIVRFTITCGEGMNGRYYATCSDPDLKLSATTIREFDKSIPEAVAGCFKEKVAVLPLPLEGNPDWVVVPLGLLK